MQPTEADGAAHIAIEIEGDSQCYLEDTRVQLTRVGGMCLTLS